MIISVINAKGGVGKTTTAMLLAGAFSKRGRQTLLLDTDRQGSATRWAERAESTGNQLPWGVKAADRRMLGNLHRVSNDAVTIIDTPPGDVKTIDAAIAASDFVIIPTRANIIEVDRVWALLPSLRGVRHGVLITSARLGTRNLEEFRNVLKSRTIPAFDGVIPLREAIADTYGTCPDRLWGHESVADEIEGAFR